MTNTINVPYNSTSGPYSVDLGATIPPARHLDILFSVQYDPNGAPDMVVAVHHDGRVEIEGEVTKEMLDMLLTDQVASGYVHQTYADAFRSLVLEVVRLRKEL